ncbi:MAG TPA: hypothetical protein VHB21_28630, partial [Minicystis sp.]|nr:hypothetical protein [Minicystis sp.]
LGTACPAGALATAGDAAPCTPGASPGETDPAALRCGAALDDLAVGLSGLAPSTVWLTRASLLVEAGKMGVPFEIGFGEGAAVAPIVEARHVDESGCASFGSGSGQGSSTGTGRSSGSGSGSGVNFGAGHGQIDLGPDTSGDTSGDACNGDSAANDACDGASGDSGDGCSGASDSSDSCDSSGSSGDGCDSGSSSDGCDSGGSSGCDSGGSSGCSGGGNEDCSVAGRRAPLRGRRPRASILAMAAFALLTPLRRRGSRRRRAARGCAPPPDMRRPPPIAPRPERPSACSGGHP